MLIAKIAIVVLGSFAVIFFSQAASTDYQNLLIKIVAPAYLLLGVISVYFFWGVKKKAKIVIGTSFAITTVFVGEMLIRVI